MIKLLRNASAQWVYTLIYFVSSFLITPMVIGHLGKEEYGIWILCGQTLGYLQMMDMGVGNSIARFVSKYEKRDDYDALNGIFNSALFLLTILAIIVFLVILVASSHLPGLLGIPVEYEDVSKFIFIILGFTLAVNFPLNTGIGVMQGVQAFNVIYWVQIVFQAGYIYIMWLLFERNEGSLETLAMVSLFFNVPQCILFFLFAKSYLPKMRFGISYINRRSIKDIFSLAFASLVISICVMLYRQTPPIIGGKYFGTSAVALIGIAFHIIVNIQGLFGAISKQFTPYASALDEEKKKEELLATSIGGIRLMTGLGLFLFVMTAAWGKDFFRLWLMRPTSGSGLNQSDINTLHACCMIMLLGIAIGTPQVINRSILMGIGKHSFVAANFLFASIMGIVLIFFLIIYAKMNIEACAWGWTFTICFAGIFYNMRQIIKYFKIGLLKYLRQALMPPIVACLAVAGPLMAAGARIEVHSFAMLILCCSLSCILLGIFGYTLVLNKELRRGVNTRVKKLLKGRTA